MAVPNGSAGIRNLVVAPYTLPEWATDGLSEEFDILQFEPGACACACAKARAMLTSGPQPVQRDLIDQLPALEYICCLGSGYEGVDVAYARSRGIAVSNSASVTAEDVADQMLAITLGIYCQVPALDKAVRDGLWPKPIRPSLRNLKVGILGLGAIGLAVAKRISAFGCEIRWHGPHAKDAPYPYCQSLLALAEWADFLLVTARADQSNRHLVDADVIAALGPGGFIANVSRGTIIDEDALIAALRSGRLRGAALDVFESEPTQASRWEGISNAVLSPHVGGFTLGVRSGINRLVHSNMRAFFAGTTLTGVVS
jgi:lactate dehydrogenase-like 2-hydroxyacid dehydrogenase